MKKLLSFVFFVFTWVVAFAQESSTIESSVNTTIDDKKEIKEPTKARRVNKDKILNIVNEYRNDGWNCTGTKIIPVREVTWSDKLTYIAECHRRDMHDYSVSLGNPNYHYLSHIGSNGYTLEDRLVENDYYSVIFVENIAYFEYDEDGVINQWLDSPEFCKNIMRSEVTEIGVGRVGNYWTMILAKPKTNINTETKF